VESVKWSEGRFA